MELHSFVLISGGLGLVFVMTCLGSATVFLFRKNLKEGSEKIFLGFAAGMMIGASVFGLLMPAMEDTMATLEFPAIPIIGGFILGVLFLLGLDNLIPHIHPSSDKPEGLATTSKRTTLLVSAVTLHNIPEGIAVGLTFAVVAQGGHDPAAYAGALALAIGIGVHNFPESAAISNLLREEGLPRWKAFVYGSLTGIVEPIFGLIAVLIAAWIAPYMPWLLSFAAGAMFYVVVEELIPEAQKGGHSHSGTISILVGFISMMLLDMVLV